MVFSPRQFSLIMTAIYVFCLLSVLLVLGKVLWVIFPFGNFGAVN